MLTPEARRAGIGGDTARETLVRAMDSADGSATRDRGTCTNKLTISRHEVQERVLSALQDKLMRKDFFDEFCHEFAKEMSYTDHVVPAFGVGPLDSLMNAVALLRDFHEQIGWSQISQESAKRRSRGRSR